MGLTTISSTKRDNNAFGFNRYGLHRFNAGVRSLGPGWRQLRRVRLPDRWLRPGPLRLVLQWAALPALLLPRPAAAALGRIHSQDWMSPDARAHGAPSRRQEEEGAGQNKIDRDDRMDAWPIMPDDRLCFKLHWFSRCPLGYVPIACPDLCRRAQCHGYPRQFAACTTAAPVSQSGWTPPRKAMLYATAGDPPGVDPRTLSM
ncbi:hypothetical protein NHX12_002528 [Muraenolepis orangiensis]|uniref:Uncharacterized protein n=1 Tax=Muraenolepis orangiensis TaxID=630683 RepID=A0A9Q0DUN1_9TELE|nr:hypothetical protein NHX12_002528 [Muraenolepis orangiensis]